MENNTSSHTSLTLSKDQQKMLEVPQHIQYEAVKKITKLFWKSVQDIVASEGPIVPNSLHPSNIKGGQNIQGALESYRGFVLIGDYHKVVKLILDQINKEGSLKNLELFIIFYFKVIKERLDSMNL